MTDTSSPARSSSSIVVGIDVGAETTKVVLDKTLDFEIVRNLHGGHSTPSSVTFSGRNRRIGEDAAEAKNADANTVLHVGKLVLCKEEEEMSDESFLSAFYRFEREKCERDRCVAVIVDYNGERKTFEAPALLAMLLGKIRRSVEATVRRKLGISDVEHKPATKYVLAVPPRSSETVIASVKDAAYAAGMGEDVHTVSAAECTTSVYGRKFGDERFVAEAGRVVLVVDMGHSQTTTSVLRLGGTPQTSEDKGKDDSVKETMQKQQVQSAATVLSSAHSASLGAGNVDVRLWQYFQSTIPGLSTLKPNSRRGQRLLHGCCQLKHLLSMLPSASVTVESLGEDDRDVTLTATMETLQDLCKAETEALSLLITKTIQDATSVQSTADVKAVEILGGGCRIPFVQDTIIKSLGRSKDDMTLSRSMDDTSVAMGAAMLGERSSSMSGDKAAVDIEKRNKLFEAEQAMSALDHEMAKLSDARNKIESHVLELRSARHGKHGSLLPEALDAHLDEVDDWLFSDECNQATLAIMEEKLNSVLEKSNEMCHEYLEAIKKDAEETERQLKEEEERARAEREAAGEEDDDHDTRRLPKKRRMEIVMKNKAEANELFADKNYRFAAARYAKALSHCDKFFDLTPEDEEEVNSIKLSLLLNLALAYLKLEKYDNALKWCNDALNIDADNTKALFRRATVYYETKKYDDAKKDLDKAAQTAPDDVAIKKLQARLEQQQKRQKAKEKKMAQKMFG